MTYRILCWLETNFEICSVANHCGNVLPGIKSFTSHGSVARERVGSLLIGTTKEILARNSKPYVSPVKNDMDLLTKPCSVALPGTRWSCPAGKPLHVLSLPEIDAALEQSNSTKNSTSEFLPPDFNY